MMKSASSILLPMYVFPTLPASDVLLMKGQMPLPAPSAIPSCAHTVTQLTVGGEEKTAIGGIHPHASLSLSDHTRNGKTLLPTYTLALLGENRSSDPLQPPKGGRLMSKWEESLVFSSLLSRKATDKCSC